jgi:hypothetical protein
VTQALAVADPVPVRGADAAVLARDALVRSAGVTAPPDRGRHRRGGRARGVAAPSVAGAVVLGAGLAALVLLGRDGAAADAVPQGAPGGMHVLAPGLVGDPVPPRVTDPDARLEGEVVMLTRARAAALARGDLLRLLGVTVPGSPAALADLTQIIRRLDLGGAVGTPVRVPASGAGVDVRVDHVRALPADDGARVLLVAAVGAGDEPAEARGVVLTLSTVAGTWRVTDVEAADGGSADGGPGS